MNKRNERIVANRTGHKVLFVGKDHYGDFSEILMNYENAQIDTLLIPKEYNKLDRLKDYTLVILDYAPFVSGGTLYSESQNVFDKLVVEALDAGTIFCFVHYNESVPDYDEYSPLTGYMSKKSIIKFKDSQLGFRWLDVFSIRPYRSNQPIVMGTIHFNIFRPFLQKWGASHNYFSCYGRYKFDEIIYGEPRKPIGFVINVRNGRLIYLPFQRDLARKDDFNAGMISLIDCLLTYITKSLVEIPEWAMTPYFQDEEEIAEKCSELEKKLYEKREELKPFVFAKEILCQAEYSLEKNIPLFLNKNLDLATIKNEQYKEDFWILNDSNEKIVIGEVKSYVKGFKRSGIFSLYNHRESNQLNADFPALLITNNFLQVGSWKEKDRPIDKQDYEIAAQNNILILRVEDLVRLWDAYRKEIISKEKIISFLTEFSGWLEVLPGGEIKLHN